MATGHATRRDGLSSRCAPFERTKSKDGTIDSGLQFAVSAGVIDVKRRGKRKEWMLSPQFKGFDFRLDSAGVRKCNGSDQ